MAYGSPARSEEHSEEAEQVPRVYDREGNNGKGTSNALSIRCVDGHRPCCHCCSYILLMRENTPDARRKIATTTRVAGFTLIVVGALQMLVWVFTA
jgi:hypothetical protein